MKKLEKISCLCAFALMALSAAMYALFFKDNSLRVLFQTLFIIASAVFLLVLFIVAKRKKIVKRIFSPLINKMRVIYLKTAKKIRDFLPKVRDDKKSYVLGKDEIKLRFSLFSQEKKESRKKAKIKLPKYETLKTDRDRVRYLYTAFLCRKAEKGYRVDPASTPAELSRDFTESDTAKTLFEAYPSARYADENDISKETLEYLENNIEH